ncbi:IS3 family transposase [Streptomyces olivoreticuli]|uniref:IS3 family transposase n=1 Tax=Streptomyces olivoreticuli TaxID=68246 RepID=UPI00346344C9
MAPPRHPRLRRPRLLHPPETGPGPKRNGAGLSLYRIVRELQTLPATWTGACPTCHRDIPTPTLTPTSPSPTIRRSSRRTQSKRLCTILGIARSSFYYWRKTAANRAARQAADAKLAARIRAVHRGSDGTYGVPRVTAELREDGECVNHKRIARHAPDRPGRRPPAPPAPHHRPGPGRREARTGSAATSPRPR